MLDLAHDAGTAGIAKYFSTFPCKSDLGGNKHARAQVGLRNRLPDDLLRAAESIGWCRMPIPPFLPQTLTAAISDNSAVMLVAKYSIQRLKLYGGYERITYMAPSDPQTAFTDIAGSFLCENCTAINNTNIVNTAFGRDGFGNKILQVMWTGVRYSVTEKLDVVAAYYHYTQNSYFGSPATGPLRPAPAASTRNGPARSTRSPGLSIGSLPRSGICTAGSCTRR
jgi:hypothetical protein